MATQIRMPRLSETTDEVRFIRWLVQVGDAVKRGQPICEVENDKATMEVESFASGTVLRLCAEPDAVIATSALIALVGEEGESLPQETPPVEQMVRATPLVQNLARKLNVDLSLLRGTGPGGLVTREDIEVHLKSGARQAASVPGAHEHMLSPLQKTVARRMAASKRDIPHFYLKTTVFADRLIEQREEYLARTGGKLSLTALLIHASARALKEFPKLNGWFMGQKLAVKEQVNIGFAFTAGEDLYVPVVKDAAEKDPEQISREIERLAARAREKSLEPEDVTDGTFTITNLGPHNVEEFYPIINPPQVAILAIGAIKKSLDIAENDVMRVRRCFALVGSFDHRVVNGTEAARFMAWLKKFVETQAIARQ